MGQKTNPVGLRLGITVLGFQIGFQRAFSGLSLRRSLIRNYLRKRLEHGGIAALEIERTAKRVTVGLYIQTGNCYRKKVRK